MAGFAAVAADAAFITQGFQRDMQAMIGKHDSQGHRAAFGGSRLQQGGRMHPAGRVEESCFLGSTAGKPRWRET